VSARVPVTFVPAGVTVWVETGSTVIDAARQAGVIIPVPCGGRGVCGKCGIKVLEGDLSPADDVEKRGLTAAPGRVRLACRARVDGPVSLRPLVVQGALVAGGGVCPEGGLVAAVDLGTSTVGAVIVGKTSGRELGRATVPNAQQTFGSDVLSRIGAARDGNAELLQRAAEDSVLAALAGACGQAGACLEGVERLVVAGNTAMVALLAGADITGLAGAPFKGPAIDIALAGERIAGQLAPDAAVRLVPSIQSFVGGDLVAGLLARGVTPGSEGTLYVDIGTNAEIALAAKGRLYVASTAAGPAFEGYGISSGGPAVRGGIQSVRISGDTFELDIIGEAEPCWLTGSGLLSLIAELRRVGHLDASGLMHSEGPVSASFAQVDGVGAIEVAQGGVYLLQTDVRAFQTAKAAVAAGVIAMAHVAGVKHKAVERAVIAGAFGAALEPGLLIELGILPQEFADKIEVAADAALVGAAAMALDESLEIDASVLAGAAHHIEVASEERFVKGFVAATALGPYRLKTGF
jgi:uncharacterized 2Fe-2S/4Fe-4S cluster protein (DUF4445 family)